MSGDTPFHRRLFIELSLAEQDAFLEGIRLRRLSAVQLYQEMQEVKRVARDERTRDKIEKQCAMLQKEIDALAKATDKVDARMVTLAGLRLIVESEV